MEAFELRLWDGRLGRWLTVDPYGQYHSPYLGMGNNPINLVDPDGGWADGGGDPPSLWQRFKNWLGFGSKATPSQGVDVGEGTFSFDVGDENPHHISNGIDSHLVGDVGTSSNYGALGSTTNGAIALPQSFGDWNSAGSDGRQWIGCMACHGENGAYRSLAYNSPSRYIGISIAATINLAMPLGGSTSAKGVMNPSEIHFMQSSIKNTTGEFTVLGNAEALASGTLSPRTLRMNVWRDANGKVWTLDHRRLGAFRLSGLQKAPVRWSNPSGQMWKMTTTNGGTSIKLKLGGGNSMIIK